MGLFDFFKRRRDRERAVPSAESGSQSLGSFADGDGPVVGQQVGGAGEFSSASVNIEGVAGMAQGLEALAQLGPMIQKAVAEGNVTIEQGPSQTIYMRGSGLREEILGIMRQHGIDPEGQSQDLDVADYGTMQQQILEVLAKHGIDPSGGLDLRAQREDD